MVSQGVDLYEIVVDDEGEDFGDLAPPHLRGFRARRLSFPDPVDARLFLERVADDYSELLALREVFAHYTGHDDIWRVHDAELTARLAELIVAGRLTVNQLSR